MLARQAGNCLQERIEVNFVLWNVLTYAGAGPKIATEERAMVLDVSKMLLYQL